MSSGKIKGRPKKPYRTSWGEEVPGLTKCGDGRWRINATEQRFTDDDERRAVTRAKRIIHEHAPSSRSLVVIPAEIKDSHPHNGYELMQTVGNNYAVMEEHTTGGLIFDGHVLWPWLREQLLIRPDWVAEQVGIPELKSLARFPIPQTPIKLSLLISEYVAKGKAKKAVKNRTETVWEDFVMVTGAKTTEDLTTERLLKYQNSIETHETITEGSTKVWTFGRVKNVIAFGSKVGMDSIQIAATLERCKVLWTSTPVNSIDPRPISREVFHQLLAVANPKWRAMLLVGLNCACYLEEIRMIRIKDIDFKTGTYKAIREKTKAKAKIPRAPVLWPETLEALKHVRSGPDFLFTSSTGTGYSSSASLANDFADQVREKAGLTPNDAKFSDLRDGAYTVAAAFNEGLARVLAGHSSPGYQDRYVLRHPEIVRPVCDAVRQHYFG